MQPTQQHDRLADAELGDRRRHRRRGGQHVDAARMAFAIVNIGFPIGLYVQDRPQIGCTIEPFLRHSRLTDNYGHIGQMFFDKIVRRAGTPMRDDPSHRRKGLSTVGRVDHCLVTGERVHENQWLGHFIPELAMPVVMNFCRNAKTTTTGMSVTTVIARM